MIAISIILASVLFALIAAMMARVNTELDTKYEQPRMDQWGLDDAGVPFSTVLANQLLGGRMVEDHPTIANTIRYSSDASLTLRGVLMEDQEPIATGSTVVLSSKKRTYRKFGMVRVRAAVPMNKHTVCVAAANGDVRPYNLGVDDPRARCGRTECGCTAAGDYVDFFVNVSMNGGA